MFILVLQAVHGGGNAATSCDEVRAGLRVHRHHRGAAKQSAHLDGVPHCLAGSGQQTDGGGLAVHHADGRFVGDDGGNEYSHALAL